MDSDPDWTANALFSPSKARIAQAQARDWGFVDTWLAKKYGGKRPPACEKNEETLQALLTLATLNESADEQRTAVEKVERVALQAFTRPDANEEVYQAIFQHLNDRGEQSLDALTETIISLGAPARCTATDLASATINLQVQQFDLGQLELRLDHQMAALQHESTRLKGLLRDLKDEGFHASTDLPERTAEWTKGSKHLKAKIGEYDERLSAVRSPSKSVKIEDVVKQSYEYAQQQDRLKLGKCEQSVWVLMPC